MTMATTETKTPLAAGTRPTNMTHPGYENLAYTREQLDKLETMKDPAFETGVARKAYVNHILAPDGTLLEPSETKRISRAIKTRIRSRSLEAADLLASIADFGEDEDEAAANVQQMARDAMADVDALQAKSTEIEDHLDQKRFLIICDEHMIPMIYFQCATDDNPDRGEWKKAKKGK